MRGLYSDKGWTEFMGAVFDLLHQVNNNVESSNSNDNLTQLEWKEQEGNPGLDVRPAVYSKHAAITGGGC